MITLICSVESAWGEKTDHPPGWRWALRSARDKRMIDMAVSSGMRRANRKSLSALHLVRCWGWELPGYPAGLQGSTTVDDHRTAHHGMGKKRGDATSPKRESTAGVERAHADSIGDQ
jgi:hypothetical protein